MTHDSVMERSSFTGTTESTSLPVKGVTFPAHKLSGGGTSLLGTGENILVTHSSSWSSGSRPTTASVIMFAE